MAAKSSTCVLGHQSNASLYRYWECAYLIAPMYCSMHGLRSTCIAYTIYTEHMQEFKHIYAHNKNINAVNHVECVAWALKVYKSTLSVYYIKGPLTLSTFLSRFLVPILWWSSSHRVTGAWRGCIKIFKGKNEN